MEPLTHLTSVKKKGHWSWDELRCLSRALGFHRDLFWRHSTKKQKNSQGLSSKEIRLMIESKQLNSDLERTFNMNNAAYNIKVLIEALGMISSRTVNFTELHMARVAFQFYEHFDEAGMLLDEFILLRALKLCGRTIAPAKLMHHVCHLDLLMDDRVMLYEFLVIIPLTIKYTAEEKEDESSVKTMAGMISEEDKALFKLCDFESLLQTRDERTWKMLDKEYEDALVKAPTRRSLEIDEDEKPQKSWFIPPLADRRKWRSQVAWGNIQKSLLTEHIDQASKKVNESSWPTHCPCERGNFVDSVDDSKGLEKTNEDIVESSSLRTTEDNKVLCFKKEPIVSEEELQASYLRMEDLRWNIETQTERSKLKQAAKNNSFTKRFQKNQKQRDENKKAQTTQYQAAVF